MKKSESNLLNKPATLAMQVVNVMLQGGTGAGKTATTRAVAAALSRLFHHMNAATCLPEDFSGFPTPNPRGRRGSHDATGMGCQG